MTGVRLAVLACAVLLPAALHAQGVAPAREKAMRDAQWGPIRQDDGTYAYLSARSDEDMDHFRDLLDKAQWSDVNGVDCDQHQKDMKKFLNGAPMYWAVDKMSEDGGRDGQTLRATDGNVVEFISVFEWKSRSDDGMLNLLLHEGWHWINKETKEGVNALRAERCASMPNEEDDDDPEGGGETPEEPTTPTCTDQQVWVTWTEWERVEETTGEWVAVPGNPLDINANDPDNPSDSGVHYVPVVRVYYRPVTKGEWQTQRVCSS